MPIDLLEILTFIQDKVTFLVRIIKDLSTAVAAIVASIVAIIGLTAWKRQLKGTKEFELAHRVLIETYRLRDVIGYMRSTDLSREKKQVLQVDTENLIKDPDFDFKIEMIILQSRWERVSTVLSDYESMSAEVEALLGKEVKIILNAIYGYVRSFNTSFDIYRLYRQRKYDEDDNWRLYMHSLKSKVYASNDEDDNFKKELEEKIQDLKKSLCEYMNVRN